MQPPVDLVEVPDVVLSDDDISEATTPVEVREEDELRVEDVGFAITSNLDAVLCLAHIHWFLFELWNISLRNSNDRVAINAAMDHVDRARELVMIIHTRERVHPVIKCKFPPHDNPLKQRLLILGAIRNFYQAYPNHGHLTINVRSVIQNCNQAFFRIMQHWTRGGFCSIPPYNGPIVIIRAGEYYAIFPDENCQCETLFDFDFDDYSSGGRVARSLEWQNPVFHEDDSYYSMDDTVTGTPTPQTQQLNNRATKKLKKKNQKKSKKRGGKNRRK